MSTNTGKITYISGSVVHVAFSNTLPAIFNALKVKELILEVQGYVDPRTVRALAMGSTQGLSRGMVVEDLAHPIEVPVGQKVLGRMLDALGNPIDNKTAPKAPLRSIHAACNTGDNRDGRWLSHSCADASLSLLDARRIRRVSCASPSLRPLASRPHGAPWRSRPAAGVCRGCRNGAPRRQGAS